MPSAYVLTEERRVHLAGRTRSWHLITTMSAAIVMIVTLYACGDDEASSPAAPEDDLPPDFEEMLERTSDFQREILEDGEVTEADYEAAVLAAVQCIEDQGAEVTDLEFDETGTGAPQWQYVVRYPELELRPEVAECEATYLMDVQSLWVWHYEMPEVQEREEGLLECLEERGIEAPDLETYLDEIQPELSPEQRTDAVECHREHL